MDRWMEIMEVSGIKGSLGPPAETVVHRRDGQMTTWK